jgi:beta-glucanase (GH16 family)
MRRTGCSALLLLAILASRPAAGEEGFLPEGKWELVFADEFDGTTEDLDKHWRFQNGPSGHILCSRWRENVVVEEGLCRLLNRKETRGGQDWTSGSMWTARTFQYGYFEARYRFGGATGLNNSFWIMTRLPRDAAGRFEIDICEGHVPNEVNMNVHNWSGEHWSKSQTWAAEGADLAREFHVYGLEWTEKALVWYFDGKAIRRLEHAICRGPAHVWFSSAVMKWAGPVTDAIHGTSMDIDYVRVYRGE